MRLFRPYLIPQLLQLLYLPSLITATLQPLVVNTWPFTAATHEAYLTLTSSPSSDPINAVVAGCSKAEELQCDHTVGWGGSPDSNGETTLDALVMRGIDQNTGAVAGLRGIRDATRVAKEVMMLTEHSLLAGDLATEFAVTLGYEKTDLSSDYSRRLHKEWTDNGCVPNFWKDNRGCNGSVSVDSEVGNHIDERNHDTIGQIALQSDGRMAVGLSSNGARHRIAGRVGDAPLPGAGGYVDDDVGACVATGDGDVMMRYFPSFLGVELMRGGRSPQEAADEAIQRIVKKNSKFSGAVVCLSREGEHAAACHGFEAFSYSFQNSGKSEADVEVIKIQPLNALAHGQKVLMASI